MFITKSLSIGKFSIKDSYFGGIAKVELYDVGQLEIFLLDFRNLTSIMGSHSGFQVIFSGSSLTAKLS